MTQRRYALMMAMAVLVNGSSAWACYNDSGSEAAEREFRSRYDRPAPASRAGQINARAVATAGAGVLLNVTAVGFLVRRRAAKLPVAAVAAPTPEKPVEARP